MPIAACVFVPTGVVVGTFVALILLISLSVFCYWRYDPEDKREEEKKKRERDRLRREGDNTVPYSHLEPQRPGEGGARSSIGARYADGGVSAGHANQAFYGDDDEKQDMVQNEYVKHPGMTRDRYHHDEDDDGRAPSRNHRGSQELKLIVDIQGKGNKQGYEQQSSLAGMAALSHMSYQDLPSKDLSLAGVTTQSTEVLQHAGTAGDMGPIQLPPLDEWEIARESLDITEKLGEGSFGEVWRAEGHELHGSQGTCTVAVKVLKGEQGTSR